MIVLKPQIFLQLHMVGCMKKDYGLKNKPKQKTKQKQDDETPQKTKQKKGQKQSCNAPIPWQISLPVY